MRSIVIDWLVDVHRKFKMRMETLFITISIMDRYLEKNQIRKEIFQLVAASSLFIAAKYEEIYPPALEDFVYICADTYNKADIIEMESLILDELEFALVSTSSHNLLGIYTFESSIPLQRILAKKQTDLCLYFLHLMEMNYKMVVHNHPLKAASAILLSHKIMKTKDDSLLNELAREFSLPVDHIKACSMELFLELCSPPNEKLSAIRRKFSQDIYSNVSSLKVSIKNN